MLPYVISYVAAALVFLGLDFVWLSTMSRLLYRPTLGDLLIDGFRPAPAIIFYLLYVVGMVIFAISPAFVSGRWTTAFTYGALFGFFAYATYDLTNQATLRNWTTTLTLVDLSWGTLVTALSATAGYLVAAAFLKSTA